MEECKDVTDIDDAESSDDSMNKGGLSDDESQNSAPLGRDLPFGRDTT